MNNELIKELASNPWSTIGGIGLGVAGVLLAIVFYFKSKREKTPCFEITSKTLIDGIDQALDGLQIQYKGQPQTRVTVTQVVLWNEGKETIDKQDLPPGDPLRLCCPSTIQVLDARVLATKSIANNATIENLAPESNNNEFLINFEYLDYGDFIAIQVAHNGDAGAEFEIKGKIKGAQELHRTNTELHLRPALAILPYSFFLDRMLTSRLFFKYFGTGIYLSIALAALYKAIFGEGAWYMWVISVSSFLAGCIMFYGFRRIPPYKA